MVVEPVADSSSFSNDSIRSKKACQMLKNAALQVEIGLKEDSYLYTQSWSFRTWHIFFQSHLTIGLFGNNMQNFLYEIRIGNNLQKFRSYACGHTVL